MLSWETIEEKSYFKRILLAPELDMISRMEREESDGRSFVIIQVKSDGDFDQDKIGANGEKLLEHGFYFEVRAERICSRYGCMM